jgi:HlyD family secretion protein
VYLELETAPVVFDGVSISSAFICYEEDGTSYVWADRRGSLEKRTVTLGEYDFMNDTYQILSGLDEDDYIAFPDPELCVEGASTMKEQNLPQDSVVMPESGVF